MNCPGVYIIHNCVNGKVYVGSSICVKNRVHCHRVMLIQNKHDNKCLQNAWNKYGETAFEFFMIEECWREMTLIVEQKWMDILKSYDRDSGYNMCPTANSSLGCVRSAETRGKISATLKGRKPTKETLAKMSIAQKGRKHTNETKSKMSVNNRGMKGMRHSEESKTKMSRAQKGRKHTKEARAKNSDSHKGTKHSEVSRASMREAWKKRRLRLQWDTYQTSLHQQEQLQPQQPLELLPISNEMVDDL